MQPMEIWVSFIHVLISFVDIFALLCQQILHNQQFYTFNTVVCTPVIVTYIRHQNTFIKERETNRILTLKCKKPLKDD